MKKRGRTSILFATAVVAMAAAGSAAAPPATAPNAPAVKPAESSAAASAAVAPAAGADTVASGGIRRAAWLAGCWLKTAPGLIVEEQWLVPRGKNMLGISRTMRGDHLAEYELLILREDGDRLAYEAHPSSQATTVFMSRTITDTTLVFEDLDHDFPQRVAYELKGDSLLAWIEGTKDGKSRRIEYPYTRVPCAGK